MQIPHLVGEALLNGATTTNLTLILGITRHKQQVVAAGIIVSHWRGSSCRRQRVGGQFPRKSMAPAAAARVRWHAAIFAVRSQCKVWGDTAPCISHVPEPIRVIYRLFSTGDGQEMPCR